MYIALAMLSLEEIPIKWISHILNMVSYLVKLIDSIKPKYVQQTASQLLLLFMANLLVFWGQSLYNVRDVFQVRDERFGVDWLSAIGTVPVLTLQTGNQLSQPGTGENIGIEGFQPAL